MPSLSEETGGRVSMLMPGSTIGIIGGGQLGRMMALSARYMGFRVGVLDPTPNCPTGQVADFQITAEYDDKTAIHDLAVQSDVLTYEFENVDAGAIDEVRGITATPQGTDLLRVTQHRVREKQFINDHGTATAPWRAVNNFDELDAALGDIHYPAVLKTVSGGYDGHGQLVLRSDADLEKIRSRSDRGGGFPPSILEGFVDFAFEASILVSGNGKDFVTFPIVRNEHRNNILHMTIAPAEVSEHVAREAHELAIRLAKGFELAGTLAIELFTEGSLNTFAKPTNVDTSSRILCYDIRDLGKQLLPVGMLVVLDSVFNRIIRNRRLGRSTWVYIDEIYVRPEAA